MRKLALLPLLLATTLSAQTINVSPATSPAAPKGTTQSCTAIVNGYNDKSVTWSVSPSSGFTPYPGLDNGTEPSTYAIQSSSTTATFTVTATANANHALTGSCTITYTPSPTPVTTHPRLLITASMLPSLQAKGLSSNLMYNSSIKPIAANYFSTLGAIWTFSTWSGSACVGGSGPSSDQSGNFTEVGAFWMTKVALFDNSSTTRNTYGCAARDVFMTNVGYVNSGSLVIQGNRAGDSALEFSLLADWLMGGGYLSASDQTAVRLFLYNMAQQQIAGGYGTVTPIGNYNSLTQFQQGNQLSADFMRAMGNNYTNARILLMTAVALTFNDNTSDDPPLTNTCSATRYQVCPDGTAGSLHAYWPYVTGGLLFNEYAHLEDPAVVLGVYNANYSGFTSMPQCNALWTAITSKTVDCLGDGRGGEPVEGYVYGVSTTSLRRALTAIHTAGYDDPTACMQVSGSTGPCPQLSLDTSSYWDLRQDADLVQLTGLSGSSTDTSRWNFLTNADTNTYYSYMSYTSLESAMLEQDFVYGRSDRNSALEWPILNLAFGGPNGTSGGCSSECGVVTQSGNDLGSTVSMEMFIAGPNNPLTSLPSDPRPSLPTDWYDAGNQHVVVRDNGWTTGADTVFSEWCTTTQIDHEHQFCGGFDVYSNGEYITKGRTEFNDYNDAMSTAIYKNTEPLLYPGQTFCLQTPFCSYWQAASYGGEFWHGYQAGTVTLNHAELPAYVAATDNAVNAYNGGNGVYANFNAATAQSRSLVYIRGSQQIVYYDRGATGSNVWDKTDAIMTTGAVTLSGSSATWSTHSTNQKAKYTSLLPAGATVTAPKLPVYVTVSAPFSSLNSSSTMQGVCIATFADGTTLNVSSVSPSVWYSDNPAVFTVSTTGLVTPVTISGANLGCNYQGSTSQGTVNIVSGSSSGTMSAANLDQQGDWEPFQRVQVDAGNVTGAQFLSVLQWGASSFTPATATAVSSTAGQTFDGALVGTTAVWFMRTPATFTGMTCPASGATTQYVSDLAPNTSYGIAGTGAPSSATTDDAGVLTFAAAGTGNIVVSPSSITAPPINLTGTITLSGNVQLP